MSKRILAGIVTEGRSNLQFHALRDDDTAACSSYICVRRSGFASEISKSARCKSRACQKRFAEADAQESFAAGVKESSDGH